MPWQRCKPLRYSINNGHPVPTGVAVCFSAFRHTPIAVFTHLASHHKIIETMFYFY
jgi:hypothetical protein